MERSIVVGTAGHIDHGKSALVRALTGTDPDRLKEEKERGITIDLGFAHLDLGEGLVASFIDVPGHERFVRNMLAGAHGIDTVLLVVAADEGVMPQTREHFHICRFLGIRRGALVLTKCDAASEETQAVAEIEVQELVQGSFLDGAPLLRTSAKTGLGLEALKDVLRGVGRSGESRGGSLLRMPVDRSFSVRGFGTVVTGTLVSGAVAIEDEVEVLPGGARARVRGIEVHGEKEARVAAGRRVALNLAGIDVTSVSRGDVLARPETLRPTQMLDAELTLLPAVRPLAGRTRVRLHAGSAEVLARVHPLEPGSPFVQLRLEAPVVVGRQDRFILRSYSPPVTIGGGVVLDPLPRKQRRRVGVLERLEALRDAPHPKAARLFVQAADQEGIEGGLLAARVTATLDEILPGLEGDPEVVRLGGSPPTLISRSALESLAQGTLGFLQKFHKANPLKASITREELRHKLFGHTPSRALDWVLEFLGTRVRLTPESVALAGEGVRLSAAEEKTRSDFLALALEAGLQGIEPGKLDSRADRALSERVLKLLVSEGALARVGDQLLVHRTHLESLKAQVRGRWAPGSRLDVGELKAVTGLSRKFVIPLLEYLDRERVTRRTGADRFVLP